MEYSDFLLNIFSCQSHQFKLIRRRTTTTKPKPKSTNTQFVSLSLLFSIKLSKEEKIDSSANNLSYFFPLTFFINRNYIIL